MDDQTFRGNEESRFDALILKEKTVSQCILACISLGISMRQDGRKMPQTRKNAENRDKAFRPRIDDENGLEIEISASIVEGAILIKV
jgi:hypothetical protein